MGDTWATTCVERVVDALQGPLLQVDIAETIVHEADEPNPVVGLFDAYGPASEHLAQIN
jgi:hypothetical protein